MPSYEIDISINTSLWQDSVQNIEQLTQKAVNLVFSKMLHNIEHIEISIVLADDAFVQNLNKTYRGKDKPTNVLSFPQTEPDEAHDSFISLGDIIIAYETIAREALEQNKPLPDHYAHMLVHGCLHLLHHDHETDKEAEEMEAHEIAILSALNIKNPYQIL